MKTYTLLSWVLLLATQNATSLEIESEMYGPDKFLYFAYGSNLLAKRIHIKNPTAEFFSIAKLPNFRLDFGDLYTEYWNGAAATIVEDSESVVWGALWTLNKSDIPHLDDQEGVPENLYRVRNVTVQTLDGKSFTARTYQITVDPSKVPARELRPDRQPSNTYMEVIIRGAFECSLPMHYIRYLMTFPINGKLARSDALEQLGSPFNIPEAV